TWAFFSARIRSNRSIATCSFVYSSSSTVSIAHLGALYLHLKAQELGIRIARELGRFSRFHLLLLALDWLGPDRALRAFALFGALLVQQLQQIAQRATACVGRGREIQSTICRSRCIFLFLLSIRIIRLLTRNRGNWDWRKQSSRSSTCW